MKPFKRKSVFIHRQKAGDNKTQCYQLNCKKMCQNICIASSALYNKKKWTKSFTSQDKTAFY